MATVPGSQGGCSFNSLGKLSCPLLSAWDAGLRCRLSLLLWSRSNAQPLHWGILQMHCVEQQLRVSDVLSLLLHLQVASSADTTPNPKNSLLQYLWTPVVPLLQTTRAGTIHHPSACKQFCHSVSAWLGYRLVVV